VATERGVFICGRHKGVTLILSNTSRGWQPRPGSQGCTYATKYSLGYGRMEIRTHMREQIDPTDGRQPCSLFLQQLRAVEQWDLRQCGRDGRCTRRLQFCHLRTQFPSAVGEQHLRVLFLRCSSLPRVMCPRGPPQQCIAMHLMHERCLLQR